MESSAFSLTVLITAALFTGVLAQVVANFFRVPSIVFLLIFGVGLGRSGLGLIEPKYLDVGLEVIVSIAVALILFEGGFNLQLQSLGRVSTVIRNLTTVGTLISWLGGGLVAHYFGEFPWAIAFLYASLVVVTGPTVINPILKEVNLDHSLATILEAEGVLIDATGAILSVVVLDVVLSNNASVFEILQSLILKLGIGTAIGGIGGFLLGSFLRRSQFLANDVKSSVVLASVLGFFAIAQAIQVESGLLTAVLMGIVVRALAIPDERLILKFNGQLTILLVSMVFVLLSANLSLAGVLVLGWGGVFTVLAIMLAVRPLNVLVSSWTSDLNWRQKLFLAWCAPRGIVAASVASLFAIILTEKGINGGEAIKALVFLTIAMTVFLQGLTAKGIAQTLKLTRLDNQSVVIIGCNALGILLAKLLQAKDIKVTMVDDNANACKVAIAAEIPTIIDNATNVKTLIEAGLDNASTVIVLTVNPDINLGIAKLIPQDFRLPQVIAVFNKNDNLQIPPEIKQAFTQRVAIKAWDQYLNLGEFKLAELTLSPNFVVQMAQFNAGIIAGNILPLVVERQAKLQIITADQVWESGDRLVYIRYSPKALLMPSGDLTTIEITSENLTSAEPIADKNESDPPDFKEMAREILNPPNKK